MAVYGVAEAKNKFTHLLERVEGGERIVIARHGKVIAEIVKAAPAQPSTDVSEEAIAVALENLRSVREGLGSAHIPAARFIRQLRDEGL